MREENDWRLMAQERFLEGVALKRMIWKQSYDNWDHDHCEFCFAEISEYDGVLHEGYCTLDEYHWICEECFEDFKDMFHWSVESDVKKMIV